jgi:GNAT superfamily N-acetyltransferase
MEGDVSFRIVEASPKDLERLHALASATLNLDTFSADLLAQKLFFNPHAGRDDYRTFIAERGGAAVGFLHMVMRTGERRAWLGLFGVAPEVRRGGVMKRLHEAALQTWRAAGITTVDVLTVPTNYLVPGIDPRYTGAICFVESMGFEHQGARVNLRAKLDGDFDTQAAEQDLATNGITIRRATPEDGDLLDAFFAVQFGQGWRAEVALSMRQDPPAVHIALRGDEMLGFAAHSSMNQEWGNFGPMGTSEAARGLGIGRVLLYRCMADLKNAGFRSSVIPWVGPYRFYCRWLDCVIERVFWQYRLTMD